VRGKKADKNYPSSLDALKVLRMVTIYHDLTLGLYFFWGGLNFNPKKPDLLDSFLS